MARKSLSSEYFSNLQRQRDREFDRNVRWSAQVNYYNSVERANRRFETWTSPKYYKSSDEQILKQKTLDKQRKSLQNRRERLRDLFFKEKTQNDLLKRQQLCTPTSLRSSISSITNTRPETPLTIEKQQTPVIVNKQQTPVYKKAHELQKSYQLIEITKQLRQHCQTLNNKSDAMSRLRTRLEYFIDTHKQIQSNLNQIQAIIQKAEFFPDQIGGNFRQKVTDIIKKVNTNFELLTNTLAGTKVFYENCSDKIDLLLSYLSRQKEQMLCELKRGLDWYIFDSEQRHFLDLQKDEVTARFDQISKELLSGYLKIDEEVNRLSDDVYETMVRNVVERESILNLCDKFKLDIDAFKA